MQAKAARPFPFLNVASPWPLRPTFSPPRVALSAPRGSGVGLEIGGWPAGLATRPDSSLLVHRTVATPNGAPGVLRLWYRILAQSPCLPRISRDQSLSSQL